MKKIILFFLIGMMSMAMMGCSGEKNQTASANKQNETIEKETSVNTGSGKLLGAMEPQEALEYMKKTPDLIVVEVNEPKWKLRNGITGAMHIPYTEMEQRYNEIPPNRPVILHCGAGVVVVEAYEILQQKRPDIPELSYIAGKPPVEEYNKWLEENRNDD